MSTEKNLCVVTGNLIVPEECFIDGGAEKMLALLRKKLKEFTPDPTTPEGLEEIRTFAAKFPKSKTAFDKAGKDFKEQYKVKIVPIDRERKIFRDECDIMRDEARLPLTLHENKQKELEEIERQKVIQDLENERLESERKLKEREDAIALKEAEMAKIEADRIAKEQAEIDRKAQVDYEAKVQKEAEERAVKDQEEALLKEQQEKDFAIQETIRLKKQVQTDLENAEKKRLYDIERAKFLAENQQREALAKQKADQEYSDKLLADKLANEKRIADRKATNRNHQKAINRKVVSKLLSIDRNSDDINRITEELAISIVKELVRNPIPEIKINY